MADRISRTRAWVAKLLHSAASDALEDADRDVLADFTPAAPLRDRPPVPARGAPASPGFALGQRLLAEKSAS
jgi:hypothetical protein